MGGLRKGEQNCYISGKRRERIELNRAQLGELCSNVVSEFVVGPSPIIKCRMQNSPQLWFFVTLLLIEFLLLVVVSENDQFGHKYTKCSSDSAPGRARIPSQG